MSRGNKDVTSDPGRSPVHVVTWFPNGRRVLTGTLAGEMTIWHGQSLSRFRIFDPKMAMRSPPT